MENVKQTGKKEKGKGKGERGNWKIFENRRKEKNFGHDQIHAAFI
jgi:hypothetical protein